MFRRAASSLPLIVIGASLIFGAIAVFERPGAAQITVKCWKEYCVTDPETGKTSCVREEIACPSPKEPT